MKHPRSFSLAQTALVALSLPFGLSLVACGGGSSSSGSDNKDSNGIAEYETFEDLYHCSRSHYGELAHVADSDSIYECTSEDWVPVDDERLDELLAKSSSSRKDDAKSSSSIAVSEGDTAKVEQVKVDSAKVTGLAQKGPYVNGTVVTLYELDKDFNHTKKKFTGKTDGEKGEFAISDIVIENQYAELEANGFYMNELTGMATSGTKTKLTALVDLSEAKSVQVNINLFTEFEKALAIMLAKYGLNVPAAKKRATQEILKAFGVNDSDIASATAISLDDTTAAGVALQAASVMVLANQTTGRSNSLIAAIADDFAQNGTWTDVETRALVADKVQNLDSAGLLKTGARDNVLRDYWTSEYGIGKCTSELEEEVKKVENKESANYGAGFACTDSRWHKVNEIDAELGLCTSKFEGLFREAEISKTHMYFVCSNGVWDEISYEKYILGRCNTELKGDTVQGVSKAYYTCDGDNWNLVPSPYGDLGFCDKAAYEAYTRGIVNDTMWVCEESGWISTKDTSVYEAIGFCKESRLYSVSGGYACVMSGSEYSWRKATEYEGKTGSVCNKSLSDKVVSKYVCEEKTSGVFEWRQASDEERATGAVCNSNYSESYELVNDYVCMKFNDGTWRWRGATTLEKELGYVCSEKIEKEVHGNYKCLMSSFDPSTGFTTYWWTVASEGEIATGRVTCTPYEMVNGYTCVDEGSTEGSFTWRATSDGEKATGTVCGCDPNKYPSNCKVKSDSTMTNGYTCVLQYTSSLKRYLWRWRPMSDGEKDLGMMCTYAMKESLYAVKDTSKLYLCRAGWTLKQDNSSEAFSCTRDNVSYWHSIVANMAVMEKNMHVRVGTIEQNVNTWCGGNDEYTDNPNCPNYGRLYNYEAAVQVCPEGWHLPTKLEMNRIGKSYKSATNWNFQYAGYRDAAETKNSKYKDIDDKEYFWTSDNTSNAAYAMSFSSTGVTYMGNYSKEQGFAVRCIKDYTVILK